jgi:hypothetical protein
MRAVMLRWLALGLWFAFVAAAQSQASGVQDPSVMATSDQGSAEPVEAAEQTEQADALAVAERDARQTRVLELHFIPVSNAQIALWIEDAAGQFLTTVGLTEAVATRGIGNRPGASQMNSGFRWPYGRREGVLPVWAHRRAHAQGAQLFRRVIFQDRTSEGDASRSIGVVDNSRDDYFCLSFNNAASKQDALDAVSCASVFSSDKGRYITQQEVEAGYAEPYEDVSTLVGRELPLSVNSLYPPRRDVASCAGKPCQNDHADTITYADHAREIMPDIDAVSMATPQGAEPAQRLFSVPTGWPSGDYRACLEINIEGDYNAHFNPQHYPTPTTPKDTWDQWALTYGYPYRGQPSVVYCVPFKLSDSVDSQQPQTFATARCEGTSGTWDTAAADYGSLTDMSAMTDDPQGAPGSGADRLLKDADGQRMRVVVKTADTCEGDAAPSAVSELTLRKYPDEVRAHEWAELKFRAASDDHGVFVYEVRVSTEPIVDEASFMRGQPAKSASIEADALRVPVDGAAGAAVEVAMGGLVAETHYYVGVRAVDGCAQSGPVRVAELDTPQRVFATVSACFVATAAYGTPLAREISVLRRFRDRQLGNHALGRGFVAAYGRLGPKVARVIGEHPALRAAARAVLTPIVKIAQQWVD